MVDKRNRMYFVFDDTTIPFDDVFLITSTTKHIDVNNSVDVKFYVKLITKDMNNFTEVYHSREDADQRKKEIKSLLNNYFI